MNYGTKLRGAFPLGPYIEGMTGLKFVRAGFDSFPHWDRPMFCQEKLDGWSGVVCRANGDCFWDNGWKQYKALQDMLPIFKEFMPPYSILVGEVGYGTEYETMLALKNGFNRFIAYDVLMWDNEKMFDWTNLRRWSFLRSAYFNSKFLQEEPPRIDLAQTYILQESPYNNQDTAWNMFFDIYNKGGEGLVLKECDGLYIPKGNSDSMYKIKKFVTKDYVCLGFTKSVAQTYVEQGMDVSSMECGLFIDGKLRVITQTAGFNFEWRKKFSEHPEQYIGRVVELGGFEVFKTGAMRHSSFLRFREDVPIESCTL